MKEQKEALIDILNAEERDTIPAETIAKAIGWPAFRTRGELKRIKLENPARRQAFVFVMQRSVYAAELMLSGYDNLEKKE